MARPRKPWSHSEGQYGCTVTIREPRVGAALRWDYRVAGKRHRPEVHPRMVVRHGPNEPLDPALVERAKEACKAKLREIALPVMREEAKPKVLTLAGVYDLYFDPRRKALPPSPQARVHQEASRGFWITELGGETPYDTIPPADVWGALLRLKEAGKVATAEKRFNNLRTLHRWLRDRMGYDTLRDPTRTLDKKKLLEGYEPARPRYTVEEVEELIKAAPALGPRYKLFLVLMADSGPRAVQVRHAMRSMLDRKLEPPPPPDFAPHGWLVLPAVKGQRAMIVALTERQRAAIDEALATWLAPWEVEWQAEGKDYPLMPGGREDREELVREPISDTGLRKVWKRLHKAAGVPTRKRLGFHGIRRSWSDDIEESEGLDTVTHAGGWSRRETVEGIYLSKVKYHHADRARKRRERKK